MDKNQKIAIGVIVIIALVAAWQLAKKPVTDEGQEQIEQADQMQERGEELDTPVKVETGRPEPTQRAQSSNIWQGKLEASDNSAKGNYRLVTSDHVIYIRTSRDYSALVSKEVNVSYKGNLDSFSLVDITSR